MSKNSLNATQTSAQQISAQQTSSRRSFVAASTAVGGLAAAAALWAGKQHVAQPAEQAADIKASDNTQAGYQLTDHVKRYYKTATL